MERRGLRRVAIILAGAVALMLATTASQCSYSEPPFPGGIRTIAKTAALVDDAPVASSFTAGVYASGYMESNYGGGTGNASDYGGYTNKYGIYDAPNAITNAFWSLSVNYAPLGTCGLDVDSNAQVPSPGVKFLATCYIGSGIIE